MNEPNKIFLYFFLSEITPNKGESTAKAKPERAKIQPNRWVLKFSSAPKLQYFLKKIGKNPAITVV